MAKAPVETEGFLNQWVSQKVSYNKRDLLTYAVGIGCTELNWIYENNAEFAAFPTYPIVLAFKGTDQDVVPFPSKAMMSGPKMPSLPGVVTGLDGEREIIKIKEIPTDGGEFTLRTRYIGVHARGSGASVESEAEILDSSGALCYKIISGSFLVGAKGFKDSGETNSEKVKPPARAPDAVVDMPTSLYQAQAYRLSGDYNPLHVDPEFAKLVGFKEPILHGLCSYGIVARAVIKQYCNNDAKKFKSIKGRFSSPVLPGQTISVEMWKEGSKVVFVGKVKETGKVCISNAYVLLNGSSM